MNKVMRWIVFAICCVIAAFVYAIWKEFDRKYGGGVGSGFLRGVIIFGSLAALWGWAKGGSKSED